MALVSREGSVESEVLHVRLQDVDDVHGTWKLDQLLPSHKP